MTDKVREAAQQALEFLTNDRWGTRPYMDICVFEDAQRLVAALQEALAEPVQEPVACPSLQPDMRDAIIAGDEVLLNEQAWLLRECRGALDSLIKQKPNMAGLLCGSTTLGNLRAELGAYRPSGVMNGTNAVPVSIEAALRDALAEPVQEPVAKVELMTTGGNAGLATRIVETDDHLRDRLRPGQLLYTAPPEQRKPLTDEQKGLLSWLRKEAEKSDYFGQKNMATKLDAVADLLEGGAPQRKPLTNEEITEAFKESMAKRPKDASNAETQRLFVRAIEAAHGIKENT